MSDQGSEVARLRAQIEQESQAAWWALHGLNSGTAQHAFINRRFSHMDQSFKRLRQIIGEEQATTILCEVFDKKLEDEDGEKSNPF